MKRKLAVVSVALVGFLMFAASAPAAPSTIPLNASYVVKLIAAPGTVNHVTITYGPVPSPGLAPGFETDASMITDSAGLIVPQGETQDCEPPIDNTSACIDTTTLGVPVGFTGSTEPIVKLGDENDTFASDNVGGVDVYGGPGNDILVGGSRAPVTYHSPGEAPTEDFSAETFVGGAGNDVIKGLGELDELEGNGGNDRLVGGKGPDVLLGGAGDDFLNARDGERDIKIDCGPGKDRVLLDKVDPKPISC